MPRRFDPDLNDVQRTDLATMSREDLEAWGWRQHELARELANRLGADSRTSSRPPSSDDPYRRDDGGSGGGKPPAGPPGKAGKPDEKKGARPSGKRPGTKGFWRSQPVIVSTEVPHAPKMCADCGADFGPELDRRCVGAHVSLELSRGLMCLRVTATKHVHFAVRCPCGRDNVVRPGVGLRSEIEGRRRNLQMILRQAQDEGALSGRPDAGDLHRGPGAALPPLAAQDPGIPARLAGPGTGGRDDRSLRP